MIPTLTAGRWLVTGGPGTGKTRGLRERFATLVEGGADPERIALFVLSRRAAREAREGIAQRLARSLPALPVLTVHGYAFGLVRRRAAELGYTDEPFVLGAADQYAAVRELLAGEDPERWPRFGNLLGVGGFAREVADTILRAQERLLGPEDLPDDEVSAFYRRYLEIQSQSNRLDFAGLLTQAAALLQRGAGDDDAFEHLLVDDYQDMTEAGEAIVAALAPAAQSVAIAADPDGHVFSYRGASIEPFERLDRTNPGLERIELRDSSRAGIAGARLFAHPGEEADAVAHELLAARVDEDVPWERMAVVLRRYGAYLPALRHALARHGIPHVVVGEAAAIAAEPAVAPVIDLLRYALRPELRDDLVEPVLGSAAIGLDPHRLRALRREARKANTTVRELVEAPGAELPADLDTAVRRLHDLVEVIEAGAAGDPAALFFEVWSRMPSSAQLVAAERHRDLDALAALGDILRRFGESRPGTATIGEWLDVIEAADFGPDPWVPPEERHPAAVRITTAHRAHGAELDVVCVAGCVEGEFPSLRPRMPMIGAEAPDPASDAARRSAYLAEERRLFRLATTRATRRTVLFASSSPSWRNPRTPSRYAAGAGLEWTSAVESGLHSSLRSIEASLRRTLADASKAASERLAALASLAGAGAQPAQWWGSRDWTRNDAPMHEGEIATSYSRLSTLENCALQYLYDKEMGLDTEKGSAAWLGTVVHDIIQRAHEGTIERTTEALKAALEARWEPGIFGGRAVERQRYRDALGMLERWRIHDPPNPVKAEVPFRFPIDGALLRGRIDAVYKQSNGHLRIVDYKTGRSYPTREELKDDLQLAAYWLATLRTPELAALGEPAIVELAYIGVPRQRDGFQKLTFSPKTEAGYTERVEARIAELLTMIREERFAPSPEAECRWCRFKSICPLWAQGKDAAAP